MIHSFFSYLVSAVESVTPWVASQQCFDLSMFDERVNTVYGNVDHDPIHDSSQGKGRVESVMKQKRKKKKHTAVCRDMIQTFGFGVLFSFVHHTTNPSPFRPC